MSVKWTTPTTESANLVTTELDSLADGAESSSFSVDNTTNKDLYLKFRIELGSITPASGGSIQLKLYNPNSDVGGSPAEFSVIELSAGAGVKEVERSILLPGPFNFNATVVNNTGVALASSGNGVYVQFYSEEVV